jgi:hypothetical protein
MSGKGGGMFGYNSDWWNMVMLGTLVVAALAAVAVAFVTYAVIDTQKREAVANAQEFERYKLSVESKVSDAKKDADNAHLETERLRAQVAWRRISPDQHARLIDALSMHRFSMYFEYSQSDPEATQFAEDIFKSLKDTPGITVYPPHPLVMPPAPPGVTVSGTDGPDKIALQSALTKAGIEFTIGANMAGEPRISVGSKPTPF